MSFFSSFFIAALCRFPGGGPGLGKETSRKATKRPVNKGDSGAKATAKAAAKTRGKATNSNSGRRIITESYASQVAMSDFVEP